VEHVSRYFRSGLSHLASALEKAVEVANENRITDRHLWIAFELLQADVERAIDLAAKIARTIGAVSPRARGADAAPVACSLVRTV
jgi:hypothetical protein